MSTNVKLSKSKLVEIIQWVSFLGKALSNLEKKVLLDLDVPLA